jgi:hypothetical protein
VAIGRRRQFAPAVRAGGSRRADAATVAAERNVVSGEGRGVSGEGGADAGEQLGGLGGVAFGALGA